MNIEDIITYLEKEFGDGFDDYVNEKVKIIIELLNEIKHDEENNIW